MLWEWTVLHYIRLIFRTASYGRITLYPSFDPTEIAPLSPANRLLEFSRASQPVDREGELAGRREGRATKMTAAGYEFRDFLRVGLPPRCTGARLSLRSEEPFV
jgi:hypothetical protein